MPTPEQITDKLQCLPELDYYDRPYRSTEGVWRCDEYGGHFRVFRYIESRLVPSEDQYSGKFYVEDIIYHACKLSVSGGGISREKIINDFKGALGEPVNTQSVHKRRIDYLTWYLSHWV